MAFCNADDELPLERQVTDGDRIEGTARPATGARGELPSRRAGIGDHGRG